MAIPTIETMAMTMALRGWDVYAAPSDHATWFLTGSRDPHPVFYQPATGRKAYLLANRVTPDANILVQPEYTPTWPRVGWDHPEVLADLPILYKKLGDKGLL